MESSRNYNSSFEPVILPKQQVVITEELEDKVINSYALEVSTRDIPKPIQELYQMDIPAATLPAITNKVVPAMNKWREYCLLNRTIVNVLLTFLRKPFFSLS